LLKISLLPGFTGARFERLKDLIPKSQLCFSPSCWEELCLSMLFLEQAARNINPGINNRFIAVVYRLKLKEDDNIKVYN
jgi:hypothetical protein